jgi:hypothetical protein
MHQALNHHAPSFNQGQFITTGFVAGFDNYDVQQHFLYSGYNHSNTTALSTSTNNNHQQTVGYVNPPQQLYGLANNPSTSSSPFMKQHHSEITHASTISTTDGNTKVTYCVDTKMRKDKAEKEESYDFENTFKKTLDDSDDGNMKPNGFPLSFTHDGYKYKHDSASRDSSYAFYKCVSSRPGVHNPEDGPCTLRYRLDKVPNERNSYFFSKRFGGIHTCHNRRGVMQREGNSPSGIRNVEKEMENLITIRATSSDGFQQCARKLANDVYHYITEEKYKGKSVTSYFK